MSLDDVADDGIGAGGAANAHTDIEDVTGSGTGRRDRRLRGRQRDLRQRRERRDPPAAAGRTPCNGYQGDDRILARDGLAERVDCGDGEDVAVIDDVDVPVDCETLDVLGGRARPDVDGDRARKPADCDDANAAVRPGAPGPRERGRRGPRRLRPSSGWTATGTASPRPAGLRRHAPRRAPGHARAPGQRGRRGLRRARRAVPEASARGSRSAPRHLRPLHRVHAAAPELAAARPAGSR